jgi:hypothetical protein
MSGTGKHLLGRSAEVSILPRVRVPGPVSGALEIGVEC